MYQKHPHKASIFAKDQAVYRFIRFIDSNNRRSRLTFPGQSTVAGWSDCSRSTVQRALDAAVRVGFIKVSHRAYQTNVYDLGPLLSSPEGLSKYSEYFPFLRICLSLLGSKKAQSTNISGDDEALLFKDICYRRFEAMDIRDLRSYLLRNPNIIARLVYDDKLKWCMPNGYTPKWTPELRTPREAYNGGLKESHWHGYNVSYDTGTNKLSNNELPF